MKKIAAIVVGVIALAACGNSSSQSSTTIHTKNAALNGAGRVCQIQFNNPPNTFIWCETALSWTVKFERNGVMIGSESGTYSPPKWGNSIAVSPTTGTTSVRINVLFASGNSISDVVLGLDSGPQTPPLKVLTPSAMPTSTTVPLNSCALKLQTLSIQFCKEVDSWAFREDLKATPTGGVFQSKYFSGSYPKETNRTDVRIESLPVYRVVFVTAVFKDGTSVLNARLGYNTTVYAALK